MLPEKKKNNPNANKKPKPNNLLCFPPLCKYRKTPKGSHDFPEQSCAKSTNVSELCTFIWFLKRNTSLLSWPFLQCIFKKKPNKQPKKTLKVSVASTITLLT